MRFIIFKLQTRKPITVNTGSTLGQPALPYLKCVEKALKARLRGVLVENHVGRIAPAPAVSQGLTLVQFQLNVSTFC